MRFVVSLMATVMLMGIVGCNTTPASPTEKPHYAWEIKVHRGTMNKNTVFFFNWTLFKVAGNTKEYMDSSNMVAAYDRAGVFSKKNDGKELKTTFSVKKGDKGTDIATCEMSMIKPVNGRPREECWKLRRIIPANLKKPIIFRVPTEPSKKADVQDNKTD